MKSQKILSLALLISALLMGGCVTSNSNDPSKVARPAQVNVVNYGNDVYYFPYTEADFGNQLSAFTEQHHELTLVSVASDDRCGEGYEGGRTCGYFVVFKKN